MGNSKAEKEQLKKLEDEAYNELCQIIAEAMQFQDITLLDQRIAGWKKKYKKLLDSNGSASVNFKKRIEYLLNEYYSEITQYILKQIRKTEQKRIENQSKALRKLRYLIDETNDLPLLKKKVKEWESKYPMSSFLNMYQKRIKVYTSEKYLKENAFDQDIAFRDLYYITKLNRTYEELKEEVAKWENNYSINDKFELDDFIKHQSEIIRYTSDDYLKDIAHVDNSHNQEIVLSEKDIIPEKNSDSSLSKQAAAYSSLMSVARKPQNIDEIFDWVYKYNSIKFNDEYKNLILIAIYRDYSPTYLNSLSVPKINLSSSLSFEEYQNIDEIKRYTVISYFNLLLPPERAVSNNYFNKHIESIYRKSRLANFSSKYNQVDRDLEKIDEIKTIYTKAEIPELEIDLSDGQVFAIPDDMAISEKTGEKNTTKAIKEPQVFTSGNEQALEIIETTKTTIHEQTKRLAVAEDKTCKTIALEEIPKQIEQNSLKDTAVIEEMNMKCVSEKDEKVEDQHSKNTEFTAQSSEVSISAKSFESKKDSLIDPIDNIKPLESKPSVANDSEPFKKTEKETVVIVNEPKVLVSETPIKSQSEDLSVTEKSSEIITTELVKPAKKHVKYSSKENSKLPSYSETQESQQEYEDLPPDTVIAFSPQFFEIMNNKVNTQKQQSTIITMINTAVDQYMSISSKSIDNTITRSILD